MILKIRHRKWSSAILRNPNLIEAVSFAALFAICTCFSLTVNGSLKKTKPTGYVFQYKHCKRRKSIEKKVMFSRKLQPIMMCHYEVIAPLYHLKVLFKINQSFAAFHSAVNALCSAAKFCYFYDLLWFYLMSMLGSKTWQSMATLHHNSREAGGLLYIFSTVCEGNTDYCCLWS